ncbi:MAG: YeeE/YedE family protein [Hyphomicrobium sp.]|nr:YeeE/YedE family protein [Hyphomicrobium sp.]MBX9862362.1 YeeE/YedE family protein [Hyphomicrobium sp.]
MTVTQFTPYTSIIGGLFIGAAAVLLMAFTGRIAGVSGFVSRLLPPYADDQTPVRLAFVGGLLAAAPLYILITGSDVPHTVTGSTALLVPGGLLVGVGSVTGSGCTSGHGVCGIARLSSRSFVATASFMATAIATVFIVRHVVGG